MINLHPVSRFPRNRPSCSIIRLLVCLWPAAGLHRPALHFERGAGSRTRRVREQDRRRSPELPVVGNDQAIVDPVDP